MPQNRQSAYNTLMREIDRRIVPFIKLVPPYIHTLEVIARCEIKRRMANRNASSAISSVRKLGFEVSDSQAKFIDATDPIAKAAKAVNSADPETLNKLKLPDIASMPTLPRSASLTIRQTANLMDAAQEAVNMLRNLEKKERRRLLEILRYGVEDDNP